jgi:hypothetical protein
MAHALQAIIRPIGRQRPEAKKARSPMRSGFFVV